MEMHITPKEEDFREIFPRVYEKINLEFAGWKIESVQYRYTSWNQEHWMEITLKNNEKEVRMSQYRSPYYAGGFSHLVIDRSKSECTDIESRFTLEDFDTHRDSIYGSARSMYLEAGRGVDLDFVMIWDPNDRRVCFFPVRVGFETTKIIILARCSSWRDTRSLN